MVNRSDTRTPRTDFVHLSRRPQFNINGPSLSPIDLGLAITNKHGLSSEPVHQARILVVRYSNPSLSSICPSVNFDPSTIYFNAQRSVHSRPISGKLILPKLMGSYSVLFEFGVWARPISGKLSQFSILEFWDMAQSDFWKTHPKLSI